MSKKNKHRPSGAARAVSQALEIPPEVALGSLRLTLRGRERLTALNHQGVIIYQPERIVFRCRDGAVAVSGAELSLAELTDEELTICGRINAVALRGDEDD